MLCLKKQGNATTGTMAFVASSLRQIGSVQPILSIATPILTLFSYPKTQPTRRQALGFAADEYRRCEDANDVVYFAGEGSCDPDRLPPKGASSPRHAWVVYIKKHALSGTHSRLASSIFITLTKSRVPLYRHLRKQMTKTSVSAEKIETEVY